MFLKCGSYSNGEIKYGLANSCSPNDNFLLAPWCKHAFALAHLRRICRNAHIHAQTPYINACTHVHLVPESVSKGSFLNHWHRYLAFVPWPSSHCHPVSFLTFLSNLYCPTLRWQLLGDSLHGGIQRIIFIMASNTLARISPMLVLSKSAWKCSHQLSLFSS